MLPTSQGERPVGFCFPCPREIWKAAFSPYGNAQEGRLRLRNLCLDAGKGWALGDSPVTPVNSASSARISTWSKAPLPQAWMPALQSVSCRAERQAGPEPNSWWSGKFCWCFWSSGLRQSVLHQRAGLRYLRQDVPWPRTPVSSLLGPDKRAVGVTLQPRRLIGQSVAD